MLGIRRRLSRYAPNGVSPLRRTRPNRRNRPPDAGRRTEVFPRWVHQAASLFPDAPTSKGLRCGGWLISSASSISSMGRHRGKASPRDAPRPRTRQNRPNRRNRPTDAGRRTEIFQRLVHQATDLFSPAPPSKGLRCGVGRFRRYRRFRRQGVIGGRPPRVMPPPTHSTKSTKSTNSTNRRRKTHRNLSAFGASSGEPFPDAPISKGLRCGGWSISSASSISSMGRRPTPSCLSHS